MLPSSLQGQRPLSCEDPNRGGWGSHGAAALFRLGRSESTPTFRLGDSVAFSRISSRGGYAKKILRARGSDLVLKQEGPYTAHFREILEAPGWPRIRRVWGARNE